MSVDLNKGATVELVKTLSDDIRTNSAGTKAESAGAAVRALEATKADKTGTADDMVAGTALQLDSNNYTEDAQPYVFRATGGGKTAGTRLSESIVGGSIAWNQIIPIPSSSKSKTENGVTITDNRDGSYTVQTDVNGATANTSALLGTINVINGHKYVYVGTPYGGSTSTYISYCVNTNIGINFKDIGNGAMDAATGDGVVSVMGAYIYSGTVITSPIMFRPQFFDLTQMFGTAVADRIYAMEQATAGAGVAWFRALFPKPYYAYDAGTLKLVSGLASHDMVGFNAWDEEWEVGQYVTDTGAKSAIADRIRCKNYIPALAGTTYCAYAPVGGGRVLFYDKDKNYIDYVSNGVWQTPYTFTTPSNCAYMTFNMFASYGTTYNHDICVSISSDKNGTYEPYTKHSYALDDSITLRGVPKVVNNEIVYDGDTYEADGTVTRKYGIVDMGTLTWSKSSSGNKYYASVTPNHANKKDGINLICARYTYDGAGTGTLGFYGADKTIRNNYSENSNVREFYIHDEAYSDAASFKTAMSGVYVVFELETPTTETADPFTNPQNCDGYGTEEYVTTGIPVGHVTQYPTDQVAKLDGLPADFSTLIAPTEKAMKATRAYTANDFLIVGNQLYKVTASIASGATLTPNTNITAVTVADILKALLNA